MSILSNIRKRGLRDVLDPRRWVIYIRSLFHKQVGIWVEEGEMLSYAEQIVYRASHPGCQACVKAGECVHCGCSVPEIFYEKDAECSGGNWTQMRSPKEWEEYKKMLNIEIKTVYK